MCGSSTHQFFVSFLFAAHILSVTFIRTGKFVLSSVTVRAHKLLQASSLLEELLETAKGILEET